MARPPADSGCDDLVAEKSSGWNGVRDYEARNFLRDMRRVDLVTFHRSNA
jgi:predicted RNA-binding protein with PUA-like domain